MSRPRVGADPSFPPSGRMTPAPVPEESRQPWTLQGGDQPGDSPPRSGENPGNGPGWKIGAEATEGLAKETANPSSLRWLRGPQPPGLQDLMPLPSALSPRTSLGTIALWCGLAARTARMWDWLAAQDVVASGRASYRDHRHLGLSDHPDRRRGPTRCPSRLGRSAAAPPSRHRRAGASALLRRAGPRLHGAAAVASRLRQVGAAVLAARRPRRRDRLPVTARAARGHARPCRR